MFSFLYAVRVCVKLELIVTSMFRKLPVKLSRFCVFFIGRIKNTNSVSLLVKRITHAYFLLDSVPDSFYFSRYSFLTFEIICNKDIGDILLLSNVCHCFLFFSPLILLIVPALIFLNNLARSLLFKEPSLEFADSDTY